MAVPVTVGGSILGPLSSLAVGRALEFGQNLRA